MDIVQQAHLLWVKELWRQFNFNPSSLFTIKLDENNQYTIYNNTTQKDFLPTLNLQPIADYDNPPIISNKIYHMNTDLPFLFNRHLYDNFRYDHGFTVPKEIGIFQQLLKVHENDHQI